MNIKNIIDQTSLKEKVKYNEEMSKYTSFKIGGKAEALIKITSIEELKEILLLAKKENINLTVIGNGSNILVKDSGIKGIVLKIDIKKFETIGEEIVVGAGNKMAEVAQKFLQNELAGFEELSGIPGTIGGAVRMNAGAHGKEIKDIITKVIAIDYDGNLIEFSNEQMKFEYRNSIFSNGKYIICEIYFKTMPGKKGEISAKMEEYANWRKEHQPLELPNAGSTFKRGEDFITAKLIDEAGLKGYKIGGAQISTKHAGFIVNAQNATAKDVIDLIEYTKAKVYEKFQKNIELEIEIKG